MRRALRGAIQTIDQGVSALVNLALTLVAGQLTGVEGLGVLNTILTVVIAAIGIQRAAIIEPMLSQQRSTDARGAQQASLLLSLPVATLILIAGVLFEASHLAVLAVGLPFVLLIDVHRYIRFSDGRPATALAMDLVWLASLGGAALLADSLDGVLWWWVVGAVVACGAGFVVHGPGRWRKGDLRSLLGEMRGRSVQGFVDNLILQLGWYIPLAAVLAAISIDAAGEYRAAVTLMAPIGVVLTSFTTSTFVGVRSAPDSRSYVGFRALIAVLLTSAYAVVCVLLVDPLSTLLFGPTVLIPIVTMILVAAQIPAQAAGSQFASWCKLHRRSWLPVVSRVTGSAAVVPLLIISRASEDATLAYAALPTGMLVYSAVLGSFLLFARRAA